MAGYQLRKREVYLALKGKLWADRASSLRLWSDIADYEKPTRCRLNTTDRNKNDKRNDKIVDETATYALDTLEAGLFSGMSSPSRPWFKLSIPNPELNDSDLTKGYLFEVEQRMNAVLILSNFYNSVPETFGDVSTFGTGATACFEDAEDLVRFYTYPLGSFAVGLNRRREVTTFVLEEQMTVRQVVETFGEMGPEGQILNRQAFSPEVLRSWEESRYEHPIDVCWIVMPNTYANPDKLDAKYLPFTSCWFELGSQEGDKENHQGVLRESGFRTFPVMVPRWKVTGNDAYGTNAPGIMILPAVKQLQTMERKSNQFVAKWIDPPLRASTSLQNKPTSLVAAHITYDNPRDAATAVQPIHEIRGEGFQYFEEKMQQVRSRIQDGCFTKLLLLFQSTPYGQPMTAEEARQRRQEMVMIFGPALERMNEELLEKVIDRLFDIMNAAGLLPDPPQEIQGAALKVEFTSVLAEALKQVRVVGIDAFLARVMPLGEAAPEVFDMVDFLALTKEIGTATGVSPKVLRSMEEAQARGMARQQAQMEAHQAEQAATMAGAARDLGQTPAGGDTALTRVAEAAGAA